MTRARRELISLTDTPYYHCIARCVRRAFLCGVDHHTGEDFSHRRAWIVERMATLASMFAIDVCAYAVMSNHYHLVLKADIRRAQGWTTEDVITRWTTLFAIPDLVRRYRCGKLLHPAEGIKAIEIIEQWRDRLADISWYMRMLNEHIARQANAEDACTGRFWEGRFRSQALLDEQALLTCMAYVDLNPIRARMAPTPEASDFTSIQQRIATIADGIALPTPPLQTASLRHPLATMPAPTDPASPAPVAVPVMTCPLLDFIGGQDSSAGVPFGLADYLELVDWSGRQVRTDKSGAMACRLPPILGRLGINGAEFLKHVAPAPSSSGESPQGGTFFTVIGTPACLKAMAVRWYRKFFKGLSKAERMFAMPPNRRGLIAD